MFAAGIAAGIYTSNTADACHYISSHSKAEVVVLEGNLQLKKYANSKEKLLHLKAIVVWGEPIDSATATAAGVPVYSWEDFLSLGASTPQSEVDDRANSIKPGNCSTLIYTSGTTGPPKAVMISHDNLSLIHI